MDPSHGDRVSRFFAQRRLSRRQALRQGGVGLAVGAFSAAGLSAVAVAQDATPSAAADGPSQKVPYLFVQSFESGSIVPKAGEDATYTVTLEHGLGQTIYFSDRPERIVGASPTDRFLEGIGFLPENPPNAALVVETAPGETDLAVVELFNPVYDPTGPTMTYDVAVLANWEDSLEVGFTAAPTALATIAPSFGAAHLFIDDCPNLNIYCTTVETFLSNVVGEFDDMAMCWNYGLCIPCEPYGHNQPSRCATVHYWEVKCNQAFAKGCKDACRAVTNWPFFDDLCIG